MMMAPLLSLIILAITIYYEYKFVKNHKKLSYPWSEYSKKYIVSLALFLTATVLMIFFHNSETIVDVASTIYTLSYFYIIYIGHSVFRRAVNVTSGRVESSDGKCDIKTPGAYYLSDANSEVMKNLSHYSDCMVVVSRKTAEIWKKEYGFVPKKLIWISRSSVEGATDPARLHYIQQSIIDFMEANGGAVVVIDCIEFLLLYNDFRSTMKFLLTLKDRVVLSGSMMVVVLPEKTISKQEKSIIMKEFERLKETLVMEPKLFGAVPRKQ